MTSAKYSATTIIEASNVRAWRLHGEFPGICLGRHGIAGQRERRLSHSPIDGAVIDTIGTPDAAQIAAAIDASQQAFLAWRNVPAPRRGELVRRIGELARQRKHALAALITLEAGKIQQEALGEVQELIDICDFAVGLSRQLYGLTMTSERPAHRLQEQWHPLGPIAIITAFNFPMAVWAWNAMLALVCGDSIIWKPAPQTPLCAIACHSLVTDAAITMEDVPTHISAVLQGDTTTAKALVDDVRIALVSATGSCRMGHAVAQQVATRLGRCLLELGGNNAMIVTPSANMELALRAIVFSAAGTTGQRCTTLRRLIVHETLLDTLIPAIANAFASLRIGNPFDTHNHIGPLIDESAFFRMQHALQSAQKEGGKIIWGGDRVNADLPGGVYVRPALIRMHTQTAIMREETFAPLLYAIAYRELDAAIELHNAVPQGLSSAIFTSNMQEAEKFLSVGGSDCGIANINVGTSGAEIGGAFGGEKQTGGGRESGSDAWKNYMRRATNVINYSDALPLAQGIQFL